jgi:hypothetical protein
MQPPMRYTGEKPVDPLIVNVWPLNNGKSSNYSVYEDSGVSVQYQHGVFARTPIKATQTGDTLRVEIGPVQGSYPGMRTARGFEVRLPADWPPASVTVNGVALKHAAAAGKGGWSFEGNTLTTVIPIPSGSVTSHVTVEVKRAAGLTAKRSELDGFAGAMTRLRGAYDAMQITWPVASPPDVLTEAMQTGDRLSYYPERAVEEIAHFHELLQKAQANLAETDSTFSKHLDDYLQRLTKSNWRPANLDVDAERKKRSEAVTRAHQLADEAGK